jgi:hypothetical protein
MAHINFLEPPRFAFGQFNFKNFELNYLWMMVILAVIMSFMVVFGLVQRYRVSAMDKKLAVVMAEVRKTSGQTDAKSGVAKATLMDSLMQRVVWSPVLNTIANHTPDTISLNYIKGIAGGGRSISLEGSGADVLATVRFEEDLSTLPIFSKVFLKSFTKQSDGGSAEKSAPVPAAKPGAVVDTKADRKSTSSSQSTFEIQAWLK